MENDGQGPDDAATVTFSLKMSPAMRQRIRVAAALQKMTGGELLRQLIEEHVPRVFSNPYAQSLETED